VRDPRLHKFRVVLSCGCVLYTAMRPHRNESRYTCRSNQGHSYNQPWVSFEYPGREQSFENPSLTKVS